MASWEDDPKKRELWGPLLDRYRGGGPRRMLSLDGGGIRGVLTLEILARVESVLAEATGKGRAFRLCDFFDYVGGTSTGAIIAAGLARGMSVGELQEFYKEAGPQMFDKASLLRRLKGLYKSEPLAEKLKETFGEDTNLFPQNLRCLLLVVTRNATTDSPWPISSNPLAKYNDPLRKNCNLRIPLWQLVRASTAAPIFFPPEVVEWDPDNINNTFVFVDGGVTPYNNPAFLMYRMATLAPYNLGWKTGERNLLLVSVGTGAAPTVEADIYSDRNAVSNLVGLPSTFMYGALVDQDINCRAVGRCVHGAPIDSEIGDLIPRAGGSEVPLSTDTGRDFLYARYNADLSAQGLKAMGFGDLDPKQIGKLDAIDHINDLSNIGRKVAEGVRREHFGPFVRRTDKGGIQDEDEPQGHTKKY